MQKIILLAGLLLLSSKSQTQSIQIKDINFKDGFLFQDNRVNNLSFVYKIASRNSAASKFRKISFDTLLRVSDTTLINLGGDYKLVALTNNEQYAAILFGSPTLSHLVLHVVSKGYQRSIILTTKASWRKKMPVHLISSPDLSIFYVFYPVDKKNWEIQSIAVDGTVMWKQLVSGHKDKLTLVQPFVVDNRLVVIASKNPLSRKESHELQIRDHHTGQVVSTHPLSKPDERVTIDNILVEDSTLFITGRKFFSGGTSDYRPSMPYVKFVKRGMSAPGEMSVSPTLASTKFLSMGISVNRDGRTYLIGETFRNESQAAYMAKAVATGLLTLGIVSVTWETMTLDNVVVAELNNSSKPQIIKLAPHKITIGGYLPSYIFAQYAYRTGQVRYWGRSIDGHYIYLKNANRLERYELGSTQPENLGEFPEADSQTVIRVSPTYLIYFNQRKMQSLIEFRIFPLNQHE